MVKVEDVLGEFGKALVAAQNRILKEAKENPSPLDGLRTAFTLSETELEMKMIFQEDGGATAIRPVSAGESRLQDLNPGVVSSLRAKIVLVPEEEAAAPKKDPGQIRDAVLKRPDIQRLRKVFGELTVNANFVAPARRWVVDVVEPGGLTLRSLQIDD